MGTDLILNEKEISKIDETTVINTLSDFNQPFTQFLEQLNLPVEGVLYPISDRKKVLNALEEALNILPIEDREKAIYLTRFTASIMAGLFDGAITYLWNETIISLRKMIVDFDIEHAFKIAERLNNRYKGLKDENDLSAIGEYDLLTICARMELITDHVFEVFKFINYMRNHASAAHPNDNKLGAYDVLSWLDNCIKYAIKAKPNQYSIKLKQFLYNLRTNKIPDEDIKIIGKSLTELPQQMLDDLLWTLFGLYTDDKGNATINENIEKVVPYVWNASSENKKYEIGEKYGYFRKNIEITRKDKADQFLIIVNGIGYKDDDSIAYELRETLGGLKSAHYGNNNFYNEYPWAKMLKNLIPQSGIIPDTVIEDWVKVITLCYIGNGLGYREGVDEGALPYYEEYINAFKDKELKIFLNLFNDSELLRDAYSTKGNLRFKKLCTLFKEKTQNSILKKLFDFSINFNANPIKIYKTSEFKELLNTLK